MAQTSRRIDGTVAATDRSLAELLAQSRSYSSTQGPRDGVVRSHGTIDELSAPAFHHDLQEQLGSTPHTVLDLSDVDFFSAAGVTALVGAWRRSGAEGRLLTVVVRRGSVPDRVLTLCDLPHRAPS